MLLSGPPPAASRRTDSPAAGKFKTRPWTRSPSVMVPPRAPRGRLRLEILEDRVPLGDAVPLAAAALSAIAVSGLGEPGPTGNSLDNKTKNVADGLGSGL